MVERRDIFDGEAIARCALMVVGSGYAGVAEGVSGDAMSRVVVRLMSQWWLKVSGRKERNFTRVSVLDH